MAGRKTAVYFNEFEKYVRQVLWPLSIETGKPWLNNIDYKYQAKDKLILNNALSDVKWNRIFNMIK